MKPEEFRDKLCTVISKGGQHLIQTPSGELIHGLIFTRVHDGVDKEPTVIIKMYCKIKDTE